MTGLSRRFAACAAVFCLAIPLRAPADQGLLKIHCVKCHSGEKPKGDFSIDGLGEQPEAVNIDDWINALEYVAAGEMPPAKHNRLSAAERKRLTGYLRKNVHTFEAANVSVQPTSPRRLNNRELARSLADVLLLEDVGTHQPLAMLLGDTLQDGFDTNGDALSFSEYHLDQYVTSIRSVLDAAIHDGDRPATQTVEIPTANLRHTEKSNRRRAEQANRTDQSIEILDMRKFVYFSNFETVPVTGRYRIRLRAQCVDRHVYPANRTGIHDDDTLQLRFHLGDRIRDVDLPTKKPGDLIVDEWLTAGTKPLISFPTDGLKLEGNGNFKFQHRIAHDFIKDTDPKLYDYVLTKEIPNATRRSTSPSHWVHWVKYWQGPRPRLFNATVEGPIYDAWPPARQTAVLGDKPKAANAAAILQPIARRAWRREVSKEELAPIVRLVEQNSAQLGDIGSLKEGIVALLVSPSFLLINPEQGEPADRFATRLSFFLRGTTPSDSLRTEVADGGIDSFEEVRSLLKKDVESGAADAFLTAFPHAWLQLDRINFMSPDPMEYKLYERKEISSDMVQEVLHFFRYAVQENRPVPELLTADYSFVNADLAMIYELDDVAPDSKFRRYEFKDGRRGGFLGMGAFLTLTADSLATSPIHRAVYVMENFMGIHPAPPPADVEITEPDIRSATTIREVLEAHRSDSTCASCHQAIDPFGYAFENFDPMGAWRDVYPSMTETPGANAKRSAPKAGNAIDASATFLNGAGYKDIIEFRELMKSDANRDRFVRCFIVKLLTYANGEEPENYSQVDAIVRKSAEHGYRIIETIAAVVESPLFRGR